MFRLWVYLPRSTASSCEFGNLHACFLFRKKGMLLFLYFFLTVGPSIFFIFMHWDDLLGGIGLVPLRQLWFPHFHCFVLVSSLRPELHSTCSAYTTTILICVPWNKRSMHFYTVMTFVCIYRFMTQFQISMPFLWHHIQLILFRLIFSQNTITSAIISRFFLQPKISGSFEYYRYFLNQLGYARESNISSLYVH